MRSDVVRQLTDTCIKNGGDHFLQEIASKDFVSEMTNLIKAPVSRSQDVTACESC